MAKPKTETKYSGVLLDVERVANDRLSHLALFEIRTFTVEDGVIVKEERSRGMVEPELFARYMSACENRISDASQRYKDKKRAEELLLRGVK